MRLIGLDLGEKRIGVAAADDRTGVAVPVTTVSAGVDQLAAVLEVLREQNADEVVVGLPLSMSGAIGPQAGQVLNLVERLRESVQLPVHVYDERLSSVQAGRMATKAPGRRKSARSAAAGRDAVAAAVVLQAYLDSRRSLS